MRRSRTRSRSVSAHQPPDGVCQRLPVGARSRGPGENLPRSPTSSLSSSFVARTSDEPHPSDFSGSSPSSPGFGFQRILCFILQRIVAIVFQRAFFSGFSSSKSPSGNQRKDVIVYNDPWVVESTHPPTRSAAAVPAVSANPNSSVSVAFVVASAPHHSPRPSSGLRGRVCLTSSASDRERLLHACAACDDFGYRHSNAVYVPSTPQVSCIARPLVRG
jgi:hypothetical protein